MGKHTHTHTPRKRVSHKARALAAVAILTATAAAGLTTAAAASTPPVRPNLIAPDEGRGLHYGSTKHPDTGPITPPPIRDI